MAWHIRSVSATLPHTAAIATAAFYAAIPLGVVAALSRKAFGWASDLKAIRTVFDIQCRATWGMWWWLAFATVCAAGFPLWTVWSPTDDTVPILYLGIAAVASLTMVARGLIAVGELADEQSSVGRLGPLDVVVVRLVIITSILRVLADRGYLVDRGARVDLTSMLHRAARTAERCGRHHARWSDREARREARGFGLRLAAMIRTYKKRLVTTISVREFDDIAKSLAQRLDAWASGDGATALVRGIPEPTVSDRLRPLLARLCSAGVRVSLLVAAGLALTTGAVRVPEQVRAAMAKAHERDLLTRIETVGDRRYRGRHG